MLINQYFRSSDPDAPLAIPACDKAPDHDYQDYVSPFECSLCDNFYFHNNYILSNKQCRHCLNFYCVRCQITALSNNQLKEKVFLNKKDRRIKEACTKLTANVLPAYGVCFKLEMSEPKLEIFRYMKSESKYWLFGRKPDGQLYQIENVDTPKAVKKFMREYCIFNLAKDSTLFIKLTKT
jgi:hypothetical protein